VVVPLDEFPIHQAPLSMAYFATSDRNVYDRCILHCYQRDGERQLIAGLGVYPHLGVIDGFVTLRIGGRQLVVRASDALGVDRMTQAVGPLRIEVVEPLEKLRLVCQDTGLGLACDLTFRASSPAHDEPRHITRSGAQTVLNAQRFIQMGDWSGTIHADGEEIRVNASSWVGARDRSWGVRPVGESLPRDAPTAPGITGGGHWHIWVPLRFTDFTIFVIVQELADGTRILNEAVRIWPASTGRPPEQLGWPDIEIIYRPGTRHPESAVLHLMQRGQRPVKVELKTLGYIPLHVGAGYGGDPTWSHGSWKGAGWTEAQEYDYNDPELAARIPFGVLDHVAVATFTGSDGIKVKGYGVFEHGTFGRHDPSGFLTYEDVWSAE
jgi:hypothetical protein